MTGGNDMIRIVKSIEKAYCLSCRKHLPDNLYNIEFGTEVSGGTKGTDVCGICLKCLSQLQDEIKSIDKI